MRTWTVFFLLGIVTVLQLPALPPFWCPVILVLASVIIPLFARSRCIFLAGFLFGCGWALFRADLILADKLEPGLEGKTLVAYGQVVSLPEQRGEGLRFEFEIKELTAPDGRRWRGPGKARLNWHRDSAAPVPGQYWNLLVRLKQPYGFMNPGGFDYEGWLFQHRIRATGYVVESGNNNFSGHQQGQWINRARYHLRDGIIDSLKTNQYTGLVLALSLGDRSLIGAEAREVLIRSGTNHLLAISGLHISLFAALFFMLARRLWSAGGRFPLYLPAPRVAVVAAILAATGYSLLAGMSIPTQRSLIMVAAVMLGMLNYRRYPVSSIFCATLLLVLLVDPFAVMDAGFWLSFGAVAVITYGMVCRVEVNTFWWRWGRTQILVAVGLLPLLLQLFGQYSLAGLAANYVAIPWVSFVVTPLAIAGTAFLNLAEPLGTLCLQLADAALGLLWPALDSLAGRDHAVWWHASASLWISLTALVGVVIVLMPAGLPARWAGLVWMLPLVFGVRDRPAEGELWFSLLDVGQGLAAVVHTRQHTLVYDTGANFSENFNAGTAVVIPYLNQAGAGRIDMLIISHGDNDHIGGARAVLAAFPDTPVLTSVPRKFNHQRVEPCHAGQSWHWDGVTFAILHPDTGNSLPGENNQSCVLRVTGPGQRAVLFSGDIEKEAEHRLVRNHRQALRAKVLIAPHHGSKTSSTPEFITAVAPELVLFPAGYRNRFRFPNKDIISRYTDRGIAVHDSAKDGAILIKLHQSGMSVSRYRHAAKRFWHTRAD